MGKIKILVMKPVKFMTYNEEILYVPTSSFVVVGQGDSIETIKILVYMRRDSSGVPRYIRDYIHVQRTGEETFVYTFPENFYCQTGYPKEIQEDLETYYPPVIIDTADVSMQDTLIEEPIKDETEGSYDPTLAFDKVFTEIFDYIESPLFFLNKDFVGQRILFMAELLIEYLDLFQDKENIKDFLEEYIAGKKLTDQEMIDGERKRYKMKVYDAIITVIERELEGNEVLSEEAINEDRLKKMDLESFKREKDKALKAENYEILTIITKIENSRKETGKWSVSLHFSLLYFFVVLTLPSK